MALQWRQPPNALKAAKTLGETLITLALNYASPKILLLFATKLNMKRFLQTVLVSSFLAASSVTYAQSVAQPGDPVNN